jgi:thiol-disulfide isomerase/thioredoxin/pimeloyl-ACP methyl ester carboxylesterase
MKTIKICLLLLSFNLFATEINFGTTTGETIEIKTFDANGENLIIYMPSSRGLGNIYPKWADELTFDGFDVWALDLHTSYMMSKTKKNMDKFNIADLVEVVDFAKQKGFKNIYFLASSRGSVLALKTAYEYQKKYKNNILKGHIFHSPHLISGSVNIGDEANYIQIASHSNLPIYMALSDSGTKFARRSEIIKALSVGGSAVFSQIFKNTSAGFFMKPNNRLTAKDIAKRNNLSTTYSNAINILKTTKPKKLVLMQKNIVKNEIKTAKKHQLNDSLKPLNQKTKELILNNLQGEKINLKDYKNKVVLINFWASWCKPCVKEIPSLLRLKEKINNPNFEILTINIGENKNKIINFKQKLKREQQVDFNLPILLDGGETSRKWNIYAYPSNYIKDKNDIIKFGYRGALEWDDKHIVKTIKGLL